MQEEAAGGAVAWLRASYYHLRQPEEGLWRAGQVPGENGGESLSSNANFLSFFNNRNKLFITFWIKFAEATWQVRTKTQNVNYHTE